MDQQVDHRGRVAAFLSRFGVERNLSLAPMTAEGVGSVQRGSAVVTIHVMADKGILLLLSKVSDAPKLDDKGRLILPSQYRD